MGKKNKLSINSKKKSIEQLQRELSRAKRRVFVECSHKSHKGKFKISPINEHGDYRCLLCHDEFNMNAIPREELRDAVITLHNAIQQIRLYAISEDEKKIEELGNLDFQNQEILDIYMKAMDQLKQMRGNRRSQYDDFGSYGSDFSFIQSSDRKRSKYY